MIIIIVVVIIVRILQKTQVYDCRRLPVQQGCSSIIIIIVVVIRNQVYDLVVIGIILQGEIRSIRSGLTVKQECIEPAIGQSFCGVVGIAHPWLVLFFLLQLFS